MYCTPFLRSNKQVMKPGHETTSVVPPSWNPAPNNIKCTDISAQNNIRGTSLRSSSWRRRELTTFSTMPLKKENVLNMFGGTLMRPRRPSSSRNPAPNNIKCTDFPAPVKFAKRFYFTGPAQNNIRGTTLRGSAATAANLKNIALRKL